jgi:hypothetical protein
LPLFLLLYKRKYKKKKGNTRKERKIAKKRNVKEDEKRGKKLRALSQATASLRRGWPLSHAAWFFAIISLFNQSNKRKEETKGRGNNCDDKMIFFG